MNAALERIQKMLHFSSVAFSAWMKSGLIPGISANLKYCLQGWQFHSFTTWQLPRWDSFSARRR
jgi:hypothetical protein